jgi:hypothetical protein
MKRALQFCGAALLTLFTSSCIEQESTVRLNKDGSGTITQTMLLSAEMVEMASQSGQDPTKEMVDKEKAAAQAAKMGEGVTLEKCEPLEKDGKKGAVIVYAFKDINKVKYGFSQALAGMKDGMGGPGGPAGDAPDAEPAKAEEKPILFSYKDGELVVTLPQDKPKAGDEKKPADEDAKEDAEDPMAAQMMEMMKEMLKDMRISFKLEVPDGIAETNATHVSGNTVTVMDVPFGKLVADPANMKKLQSMKDADPAEMANAFKGIEGLKIETKEEIKVKLK